MKTLFISFLVLLSFCAIAQEFEYEADFPEVAVEGFYKIKINPEIAAKLKSGFPDIRIKDNQGDEIPYFLKTEDTLNAKYQPIKSPELIVLKSPFEKSTFLKLKFESIFQIHKLQFCIEGTKFYRRNAILYKARNKMERRNRKSGIYEEIQSFILSSNSDNIILTSDLENEELFLQIIDNDDHVLKITQVKAYQLNTYLYVYLKPTEKYKLLFGNPDIKAPVYDIFYFKDSIPYNAKQLVFSKITSIKFSSSKAYFSPQKIVLWIFIGFVGALLVLISIKMLRAMKNQQEKE